MKVLIAEDDLASRIYLEKILSALGQCELAADGIEAVDRMLTALDERSPYDLICLDIMMPKVDGISVLKNLRKIEKQMGIQENERAKIIMITALTGKKTVDETFDMGCDAYVAKPFDSNKIMDLIEKLGLIKEETK